MESTRLSAAEPSMSTATGFAESVEPHWTAMRMLAARLAGPGAAEDVVQDALALAWRKRAQYQADRGTPRSWLLALTADQARKARRSHRDVVELPDQLPHSVAEPELDLRAAVTRLSGRQRLAVELHYFLGLPVAEVAQAMSCAEGTVKSTLSDARARLRALLGEESS